MVKAVNAWVRSAFGNVFMFCLMHYAANLAMSNLFRGFLYFSFPPWLGWFGRLVFVLCTIVEIWQGRISLFLHYVTILAFVFEKWFNPSNILIILQIFFSPDFRFSCTNFMFAMQLWVYWLGWYICCFLRPSLYWFVNQLFVLFVFFGLTQTWLCWPSLQTGPCLMHHSTWRTTSTQFPKRPRSNLSQMKMI